MMFFSLNQSWRTKVAIIFCVMTAGAGIAVRGQTAADTNATVAVYKKMSLEQLMDLDVTSVAKQAEPYGQAPAAIQVVTGDEIRRAGASSIPEALRLADNLEVAQQNSHDWSISARGFNSGLANKLLVMIDGRSVYTPLFSGVFWNAQDYLLEDIDRIEVISGPGGTLWGANAVNGVINITSKSAKDTQGLYVEGGGGNWLQAFAGVRYGGMLATNISYRVYGKYFNRGDEVYANGNDAPDSWQMGQGGFRIDDEASPQNNFTLQGDVYDSDVNVATGGKGKAGGGNILGRWSHTMADDSDLSLQLYYDRTHLRDPISNQFGTAQMLVDGLDTYDLDFQHRFHLGERNHIVWGLGYRFTQDVDRGASNLAFLPSTLDRNLFSAFVQDEIMVMKDVFFTLGTKVEHNDYTHFEFEPSGRLQWNVTPDQMLWAAVSRAVRTPSRVDRDTREPDSPTPILAGGANFESETLIAYELGYRARLTQKISTSISAFYNDYDDIRSLSFTPATIIPLFFANNLEGQTYGGEFTTDLQVLEWWRLHAGYDLLLEDIHVKPGQMDINNARNETSDPKHQVFIRSSMDLPRNIEFDTGLRWVDTLHNNNGAALGTVPSYFELEARLAWHPTKNLELAIVGQNLLHDHHPEYGFPGPQREEITRNVYGKVSYRW
ncbi:MAG TPA: TonB-dependent receptor [Candidatus Acidoferrales bacterium]|jgi:iron complex outermembrane receptor protein|nr:TonB-dependent receptor [Candidatus Acidoferrales bacterium]